MENFLTKQVLLEKEKELGSDRVILNNIGLLSWKPHSFLSPEENRELQSLNRLCINNGLVDSIGSVCENLVVRNFMWDLDIEYSAGQYRINRDTDSDRKTHIIYGFGCLAGAGKNPKSVTVVIEKFDKGGQFQQRYEIEGNNYYNWFDPFIVINRNDNVFITFEPNESPCKIYGMTCEALGANVSG